MSPAANPSERRGERHSAVFSARVAAAPAKDTVRVETAPASASSVAPASIFMTPVPYTRLVKSSAPLATSTTPSIEHVRARR